jgi:hypothetical protein
MGPGQYSSGHTPGTTPVTTIFISHSSKDSQFASGYLKSFLEREGFTVWCSSADMPAGFEWEEQIRRALMRSDWFVIVLSPDAARSDWVRAETHWALENRAGRIIPIMLRTCQPAAVHLKLGRLHYLNFRTDCDAAGIKLVSYIRNGILQVTSAGEETGGPTTYLAGLRRVSALFSVGAESGIREDRVVDIDGQCVIGRATDVDFRVTAPSVSRHHARISVVVENGTKRLEIADLASVNGTYVNGRRIATAQLLNLGDTIELGAIRVKIKQIM